MNQRFGVLDSTRSFRCRTCGHGGGVGEERLYDNVARCPVCLKCAAILGYQSEEKEAEISEVLLDHTKRITRLEQQIKELIKDD